MFFVIAQDQPSLQCAHSSRLVTIELFQHQFSVHQTGWMLLRKRDNITHFCTSASFHITGPQEKSLISTKEICII